MSATLLQSLITAPFNLQIVRDQIAAIIKSNSDEQQRLAEAQVPPLDPSPWKLRVFTERTDCRSEFTSHDDDEQAADANIDTTPVVSVWVADGTYDKQKSTPTAHQQGDFNFYIDIYGCGIAADTADGHKPGDQQASDQVLRAYALVFRFLMADININLGMPGVVGDHWPESFKTLFTASEDRDKPKVERVAVARLELSVSFLEFSPQYEAPNLELISATVKRTETGEIYFKTNPTIGV